jgi:hypothetical protein
VSLPFITPPPSSVIDFYNQTLHNSNPVPTFIDDDGIIRHKNFMYITYDPTTSLWVNTQTDSIISGLPQPQNKSVPHHIYPHFIHSLHPHSHTPLSRSISLSPSHCSPYINALHPTANQCLPDPCPD